MLLCRGAPRVGPRQLEAHIGELARLRSAEPWAHRFESVKLWGPGGRLHLDLISMEDTAPTVVFVPGTNAYALLYGEFLTALADRGINVLGLDPRGHGRSGGARGSYTLSEIIEDLETVVCWTRERRPNSPVFVAGSSQGGLAAFYLAASRFPLAGAICHNIADLDDAEAVRLMRSPPLGRALRPIIGRLARRFPEVPVPMVAYLDLEAEPVRGAGNAKKILLEDPLTVPFVRLRSLASLAFGPTANPAERVQCPVFVLQAGADNIFPEDYVRSVYDRLPGKKHFAVYPGLPHYMVVDHVPALLDDVVSFIESHAGDS